MDLGTTITNFKIPEVDAPRDAVGGNPTPEQASTNTVGTNIHHVEESSSTNLLPDSIWTSWGAIARANMSVRMYSDLVRLASAPDGWRGLGSRALQPASLKDFLEFWSLVRESAKEPELALAPDGTLQAEWYESNRKRLDLRFTEGNIFYGLFANNYIHEGVDHLEEVAKILKLHRAKPFLWSGR